MKPGAVVILNSGGPPMLVLERVPPGWGVRCAWSAENAFAHDTFEPHCLTPARRSWWHLFHRWRTVAFQPTGKATLGWDLRPVREFGDVQICGCGAVRNRGGMVVPFDRAHHPSAYDDGGWPVDECGARMEIIA